MEDKIKTLFDYIKNLCESDLDRIISFVLGIISAGKAGCLSILRGYPYCKIRPPEWETAFFVPRMWTDIYAHNQHADGRLPL